MYSASDARATLAVFTSIWRNNWLLYLTIAFGVFGFSSFLTFATISARLRKTLESSAKTKNSPTLPYFIPFIGHALSMGFNIVQFNFDISRRFRDIPIRLRVLTTDIYIVTGPDLIDSVWKQSVLLRNEIYRTLVVYNMFGMPKDAGAFYLADESGSQHHPSSGTNINPNHRIKYLTRTALAKLLTGSGLKPFAERFTSNLTHQLTVNTGVATEWTTFTDFFPFFRDELFKASTRSMCGEELLSQNPNFVDDFWKFDKNIPSLAQRLPRWLAPSAYATRDKCLEQVEKWHDVLAQKIRTETAHADFMESQHPTGIELMISRQKMWSAMEAMDARAKASEDLGLIWGSSANSIPIAFWTVLEVFRDLDLLQRIRNEVDSCRRTSVSAELGFDIAQLSANPLLQSVYAETLRLYVSTSIIRSPEDGDLHIKGWVVPKRALVMIPSYVVHRDRRSWDCSASPPLETFFADRFLTYPRRLATHNKSGDKLESEKQSYPKGSGVYSTDNLTGCFMPYGGGSGICLGRHFAKYEIITTLAILVTLFDIEVLETPKRRVQADLAGFGFGALKPKSRVPVKIRRRVFKLDQNGVQS